MNLVSKNKKTEEAGSSSIFGPEDKLSSFIVLSKICSSWHQL